MRSPKSQVSQNSSIMQTWTWESCIRVSGDGDSHYTEQIFTWEIFHKNICKIWKCNCWRCHRERSQPPISLEEKFVLARHSMTTHYRHIWGFNIMLNTLFFKIPTHSVILKSYVSVLNLNESLGLLSKLCSAFGNGLAGI